MPREAALTNYIPWSALSIPQHISVVKPSTFLITSPSNMICREKLFCFIFVSVLFCFNSERSKTIDTVLQSREAEKKKKRTTQIRITCPWVPRTSSHLCHTVSYLQTQLESARNELPLRRTEDDKQSNETKRNARLLASCLQRNDPATLDTARLQHLHFQPIPSPPNRLFGQMIRSVFRVSHLRLSVHKTVTSRRHQLSPAFGCSSVVRTVQFFPIRVLLQTSSPLHHSRKAPRDSKQKRLYVQQTCSVSFRHIFLYVSLPLEGIYVKKKKKKKKLTSHAKKK